MVPIFQVLSKGDTFDIARLSGRHATRLGVVFRAGAQ